MKKIIFVILIVSFNRVVLSVEDNLGAYLKRIKKDVPKKALQLGLSIGEYIDYVTFNSKNNGGLPFEFFRKELEKRLPSLSVRKYYTVRTDEFEERKVGDQLIKIYIDKFL